MNVHTERQRWQELWGEGISSPEFWLWMLIGSIGGVLTFHLVENFGTRGVDFAWAAVAGTALLTRRAWHNVSMLAGDRAENVVTLAAVCSILGHLSVISG